MVDLLNHADLSFENIPKENSSKRRVDNNIFQEAD